MIAARSCEAFRCVAGMQTAGDNYNPDFTKRYDVQRLLIFGLLACSLHATAGEQQSLLQTIAEWRYPDSALTSTRASDGATVDAKGDRTVESTVSRTVMTTEASVEKVLEFYKAKLKVVTDDTSGRSVVFSDESDGRPFALHTVIVNTNDTSTTLVITRGKEESKTHIAWKQYRRFGR